MHLLGCNIVYWTRFNVFLFLQDRSDVLELKREKKRVYQTSGALKTVIFSIFGKIVKNDFFFLLPSSMKSTHELSSKSCFSSPWIYALQDKTKKKGVSGEKLAKRGIETTAVTQKVQQKYIDIACKANFFPSLFETGS